MPLDKSRLLDFLGEVGKELSREIKLIAVGGTAMTLLDLKPSTIDIDFNLENEDYVEFKKTLDLIPHGFKVDKFKDGLIFSQQLPEDYLEKCIAFKSKKLNNIKLLMLNPIDIIATKIGRLNERDLQDIEMCIKKYKITKEALKKRANKIEYVGYEESYKTNLKLVLTRFF